MTNPTSNEQLTGPPFTVPRYGSLGACITAERDWLRADRDSWKARISHLTEVEQNNERLQRELRLAESARDYANDLLDRARQRSAVETTELCPHGFVLADNTCGPCSEGRPNRRAVAARDAELQRVYALVTYWHDQAVHWEGEEKKRQAELAKWKANCTGKHGSQMPCVESLPEEPTVPNAHCNGCGQDYVATKGHVCPAVNGT